MDSDRIVKVVELKATVERVWRALTDQIEFGTWFRVRLKDPFVVGQVTRGQIVYPGFEHLQWKATTVTMEAPKLFAFTWHPYAVDPKADYDAETPTRVEFRLEATASGVRLTLTESGFDAIPARRREEAFLRNEGGWEQQMENIKLHVER